MADNVEITAGHGTPILTRKVAGGEHIQQVQIDIGDGTYENSVTINNPLPVELQGYDPTLEANQEVQVENNHLKVLATLNPLLAKNIGDNPISGQQGIIGVSVVQVNPIPALADSSTSPLLSDENGKLLVAPKENSPVVMRAWGSNPKSQAFQNLVCDYSGRLIVTFEDSPYIRLDPTSPVLVRQEHELKIIQPVLDTNAYSDGDVMFQRRFQLSDYNQKILLHSITIVDTADQGGALDLYFFSQEVVIGTVNSPPSISDEDAFNFIGKVSIAAADYTDLGGCKVAHKSGLDLMLATSFLSQDISICGISRDAKTYSANSLIIRCGYQL